MRVAGLVALCCGTLTLILCQVLLDPEAVADIVEASTIILVSGGAMALAIIASTLLGISLPFLFHKVGIDPAVSSGPLVTSLNDSISVTIFMGIMAFIVRL